MEDESCSNMKKTLAKAAAVERPAHQIEAMATMIAVLDQFPRLLQSAVLLSEAKDGEAMKHIAGHVLKTAVDLAIIFSGAKTIKDVAELFKVIEEVAKTGGSVELRKKQVKAATDVLDWIEEITLVAWYGLTPHNATFQILPAIPIPATMMSCNWSLSEWLAAPGHGTRHSDTH